MKEYIGVCLGASSVSLVKVAKEKDEVIIKDSFTKSHNGNPKQIFLEKLKEFNTNKSPVVVTGRKFRNIVNLQTISEPEATEYAFSYVNRNKNDYAAIASLGGETFIAYNLDSEGKISNVITKNQCASGTGEFFLQQIKRMNLSVDEVVTLAVDAEPFKVSGRCSVFCKSDCTHALNKGTPKAEVASGLSLMMAEKVEELLKKSRQGKVLLVGGVTRNSAVMNFIRKKFSDIEIPKESTYFEALGAALYCVENNQDSIESFDNIFKSKISSFIFHNPLKNFIDKVEFKTLDYGKAKDADVCILGLDVGSTTTKAVVIRKNDNAILGSVYLYTHGNPIKAARDCYSELLRQIPQKIKIIGLGTTGSGRHISGLHALTEGIINEIVAHATAAVYFDPEVDTIFEIGGQDAKYTYIINKVPADYAMNEACSAGTGSFIEEAANESLGIKVTDIEKIAMKGIHPPNFSDQCSAFINSDIKTALQENLQKEDVVAGLVYSICMNYVNRVKGNRPVGSKIFMQGGVCYNKAIPIAMAALTGNKIVVPPEPGLMGAFGVALEVKEKLDLGILSEKEFSLKELAEREVIYKKPFICPGGREKCDRKCSINLIEVLGKTYPFGGACNKYYNMLSKSKIDNDRFDFVKKRHYLTYHKYIYKYDLPNDAKSVGINQSFHTHTIYPFYYNFFSKLGLKVILSETPKEEGLERESASFCYPAQLSLGLFQDLVDKKPDYYFVPGIHEMYVNDAEYHRKDFNCTCAFLNTEPFYIKAAFKNDYNLNGSFIAPYLNFANGFDSQEKEFIHISNQMGISDIELIKKAYKEATEIQKQYTDELFNIGKEFLDYLEKNPDEIAIVLVGRPYNSFTDIANKGIPQKFASRGVYIIPYDMIDYRDQDIDDNQYWESGKKILKVAKIIKNHSQLYATYISNFSCAPDSMIMTLFRTLMGTKPSLTLELDGHTADSGINTRIDAALDIIKNYRKISHKISDPVYKDFQPARIEMENGEAVYINSDNERMSLNDPRVIILIPSMGDLSARMFAAGFRSLGYNSIAMPEGNYDILRYGRANSSGKECLPLILCVGSMIDYIENRWDKKTNIAFFIAQGAGDCRLGQYPVFMRDLIKRKRIKNVVPLALSNEDGYAGLGAAFAKLQIKGLMATDVLDDIRSAILANSVNPDEGMKVFNREFDKLLVVFEKSPGKLFSALKEFSRIIKNEVPARIPIEESKYIAMGGEIFVRRDGFAHKWLNKYFAKQGFILKDSYITEWLFYIDYLLKLRIMEPKVSMKDKYERFVRHTFMRYYEVRIKKLLEKSAYYKFQKTDIKGLLDHSQHLIPLKYRGETGLTLGIGLHETIEHYCGMINVGPFGCMPTRTSEALASTEMKIENKIYAKRLNNPDYKLPEVFNGKMNIPFLTIEADGNVYPQVIEARLETFTLQAERIAKLMKASKMNGWAKH